MTDEKTEETELKIEVKKEVDVAWVKVAVEVEVSEPTVEFPTELDAKNESTIRAMFANSEVVVAFVPVKLNEEKLFVDVPLTKERFWNVDVAVVDVAVMEPTVNCPTEEDEKNESTNRPRVAKKEVVVAFPATRLVA